MLDACWMHEHTHLCMFLVDGVCMTYLSATPSTGGLTDGYSITRRAPTAALLQMPIMVLAGSPGSPETP
jgi:hypothetical protein